MTPLRPVAAAWLVHAADPQGRAPLPPAPIPWEAADAILATAAAHCVLPAVLRHLGLAARAQRATTAEATLNTWRRHLAVTTGFSMLLAHHANKAMDALAEAGVMGGVVKGACFARRIYPDPALRSFTDVDILVAPEDRVSAGEVLRRLGYRHVVQPHHGAENYAEDKWLLGSNPDVMVELHTNLVHNPRLRRAVRLDRRMLLAAGDGDAEDATALLLLAAVHGATSHQFDRLQHVVDVLLLARGAAGPVDAGRLSRGAAACGATETVASALHVAARLFRDPACRALAAAVNGGIPARLGGWLISPAVVLRARSDARSRDSWRRKLYRELLRR